MPCYILDTNFFIQNYSITYPPDVVPGFWTRVTDLAKKGSIRSIDKVLNELKRNDDAISRWIKSDLPDTFFISTDHQDITRNFVKVINWANSQSRFSHDAKLRFMERDSADAWLVATAMNNPQYFSIVTHEVSAPLSKKIKLPDVCTNFGIKTFNTIELFRELHTSV